MLFRSTAEDEKVYEHLWRRLGLSVDWGQQYETINQHSTRTSQRSFLELVEKGWVYQQTSPTMWDVDFKTAVAQAELEDREKPGFFYDLTFETLSGETFIIATTRPELLPACIAVVAHPDDERYQSYFGSYAKTPLFGAKVPILSSTHADPEKGSGILMICTFGDVADVDWWKQSDLPIKQVMGPEGRFLPVDFTKAPFTSEDPIKATDYYAQLEGLTVRKAHKQIVTLLQEASVIKGAPKPIQHPVKFFEKGDTPIEFISTRQWFINIMDHQKTLIAQGDKIKWVPSYMKSRYQNWVEGLNQDWCISRQRFFGVPFPVWYPVLDSGQVDYEHPIYASLAQLPVDPSTDVPEGYEEAQRGQAGGFVGDPDVMDTWATSS